MCEKEEPLLLIPVLLESEANSVNKEGKFEWYDLIPCNVGKTKEAPLVHIPAAFLKTRGFLPDLDLGDEKQFLFDFNGFEKNEKTIDGFFQGFEKSDEKFNYRHIVIYCRHLYRPKTGRENAYGKGIDQSIDQIIAEFKTFKENIIGLGDIEESKNFAKMADLLKMFILYRSVKITDIPYPLDINRDFLPDEAKVKGIDDIFFEGKDNVSVAPLDGQLHSPNEIFIKKFYALLWVNANINGCEVKTLLDYIVLLEQITNKLSKQIWNEIDISKIPNKLLLPNYKDTKYDKNSMYNCIRSNISLQFNVLAIKEINKLNSDNSRLSTFGYLIIKTYIRNKLKLFAWNKISNEISKTYNIAYPNMKILNDIKNMVEDVEVFTKEDFINVFNGNKRCIAKSCQKQILDIIIPDGQKSKTAKRRILENNIDKICLVYTQYILSTYEAERKVETVDCFHLIIASYLYFRLNSLVIKKLNIKNFTSSKFDDTRKQIGSLFTQIKTDDWIYFFYYSQIFASVLGKYHTMFDLKPPVDGSAFNDFREIINNTLIEVWQEGLNKIYRVSIM